MTSVLDTLERNSYVKRLPDSTDRRRVLVDVTPNAQVILDQLLPEVQQACAVVMAGFNEKELEGFLDMLSRVRAAIAVTPDEMERPAARKTPAQLVRSGRQSRTSKDVGRA